MASVCSSRRSDQKCWKTECVVLEPSFDTRPMWALQTNFLARYRFLKWGSKFRIFHESLKIFNDLSRETHPWPWRPWTWCPQGVFGGKLSFKNMSARGRLCTLQENPHLRVPTIKVRPPDGRCWRLLPATSVVLLTWKGKCKRELLQISPTYRKWSFREPWGRVPEYLWWLVKNLFSIKEKRRIQDELVNSWTICCDVFSRREERRWFSYRN